MFLHLRWDCITKTRSQLKTAQVGKALNKPPYPTKHLDLATQDIARGQLLTFAADWKQQLAVTAWDPQRILQHIMLAQRQIKLQSQFVYLHKAENLPFKPRSVQLSWLNGPRNSQEAETKDTQNLKVLQSTLSVQKSNATSKTQNSFL